MIFGAQGAGQASHFGADYGKAKAAATRLFALFDLEPNIDSYSEEGDKKVTYTLLFIFSVSLKFKLLQYITLY